MAEGEGLVGLPVTSHGIGNKPHLASAQISGGRRCLRDCSRPGLRRHPHRGTSLSAAMHARA